jgi:aminoglycoside 6'-N-acetyltransferase I
MGQADIRIEKCTMRDLTDWVALRKALWPETAGEDLHREAEALFPRAGQAVAFLARTLRRESVGFTEATLRNDCVNGCSTSPVAFLEGLYVHSDRRKRGIARLLCQAVEQWAIGVGCSELASDTCLDNIESQKTHGALDFEETERVVYFLKRLPSG